MKKNSKHHIAAIIAFTIMLGLSPVHATTLSEVLAGVADARKPDTLASITFTGDMRLDLNIDAGGLLPEQVGLSAAWRAPDEWSCAYELPGETPSGMNQMEAGHPAVDHIFLSRPDMIDLLYIDWSVSYEGTAMWEGDAAWQLEFTPKDFTSDLPSFTMYVRKDDFFPLRTRVEFPDGMTALTDMTWIIIEDTLVPSATITIFDPPIGPLSGYRTTWFNHEINPDLSDMEFTREEVSVQANSQDDADDGPAVFEELYHGFADDPIIAPLNDASGTYDRLEFTFSLYVEDREVVGQLDSHGNDIRELAANIISGWEWSGDDGLGSPGGKYACGTEICDAIGELLETDAITDFYFLDFSPLEAVEE